jgi:ABC-2 type transport system permease protein
MWLVARHEYLSNVRRRSFLFAAFGVPLLTIVAMLIVFSVTIDSEENIERVGTVGYVDQAGVLDEALGKPEFFTAYNDVEAARQDLDAQVIGAYFVLPPNYLSTGIVQLYTHRLANSALKYEIDNYLLTNVGSDVADPQVMERIKSPMNITLFTLDNQRALPQSAVFTVILTPLIFVMIFMLASQTTSGYLMSGVVEEKTNRIMEMLVTTVTPFQLLAGKTLGLGALGLTQLGAWGVIALVASQFSESSELLRNIYIPTDMLVIALIYFFLGYFLFAGLMAGIGAVSGSEQESRQISSIFSLVLAVPFFFIVTFLTDPDGVVPIILTLFPLTSPVTVILRMAFGTIPTWQLVASIALLALTTVFVMWASARVFRWGLLLYGKRPSLRELLRVIRKAPTTMATTATGEQS